jgi:hypothetical protein
MEATQRRALDAGDINDAESEEVEVEEAAGENVVEEHLLREVVRLGARTKIKVPMYEGNLDTEELLDWIISMDKYFDYEDVNEEKRVRHVVTRLKGHATLWWDELQDETRSKGKQKIKNWDLMVAKMKAKFMPKDYQINLFKNLQNLRQKGMTVKEYTEEFYKLNIRTGQREKDEEKVVRYINGPRYEIQDEISMMSVRTVEDAYQFALKVEEKLAKEKSSEAEVEAQPQTKEGEFPMTRHINPKMRLRNHTITWKEEEVPEEDRVVEEVLLEEEEETEEEKYGVMPMER